MIPNIKHFMVNGCTFSLVHIPGGEFLMGDDQSEFYNEKPAHRVRLSDFYLGQFPVTQALWKAVMGEGDNPSFFKGDDRPVEQVSWDRIIGEFLPELKNLTGISFRLPTEAEWEYAASPPGPLSKGEEGTIASEGASPSPLERGPGGEAYSGSNKLKEVGWFAENSHRETKPVGLKRPNQQGLYDMSGNVWEWCQDWYSGDYYEQCHKLGIVVDPQGPEEGVYRVIRGGSFWNDALHCRSASRGYDHPALVYRLHGFRLAASFQGGG